MSMNEALPGFVQKRKRSSSLFPGRDLLLSDYLFTLMLLRDPSAISLLHFEMTFITVQSNAYGTSSPAVIYDNYRR